MKKIVCLLLSLLLLSALVSCKNTEPQDTYESDSSLKQTDNPTVSDSESLNDAPAQDVEVSDTEPADDTLAAVISAVNSECIFYAKGGAAYYTPADLLTSPVGGPRHYGKSVLGGGSLLYEYLSNQQDEICEKLQSIDASAFELVDKSILQEKAGTETFHTWIENPGESTYRFSLYLCMNEDIPTEVIIYTVDYQSNGSSYYLGEYDETIFGGLTDMLHPCRVSTEETDNTAFITFAGEDTEKVLLRWTNVEFVNLVDGATLEDPVAENVEAEQENCDIKVVIGGDEYWINQETGIIIRDAKAYQLPENDLSMLTYLLTQAD